MSNDDDQPQTSRNPFIRFKNHVNTRIGTGIAVFTGTNTHRDDTATTRTGTPHPEDNRPYYGSEHNDSSSCADRTMHPFDRPRRRGDPTDYFQYWDKWAQLDPYSPYNLRHLPQPIPNDLPRDVDPGHFGFHEAFEDLLVASGVNNAPLMDLRERAGLKKSILKTFASGEPPLIWVQRLHGRGLLSPLSSWEDNKSLDDVRGQSGQALEQEQRQRRPASMREWMDERRKAVESPREKADEDIEALQGLMDKFLKEFEGKGLSWDDMINKLDKDMTFNPAEMIRKAEQAFKGLEREIERYTGELASGDVQARTVDDAKNSPTDQKEQPGTEQDLFSMIRSAVAEADRSFNSFAKSLTEMASPPVDWKAERGTTEKLPGAETVEYDPSGGRTVTTTSEHTDAFGNVHSQTEVRRINADGEEVGRKTHYSVYSSRDAESQRSAEDSKRQSSLLEQQNEAFRKAREDENQAWSELLAKSADQYAEQYRAEKAEKAESGNKNSNSSGWFWR